MNERHPQSAETDPQDDVALSVRNVSKKFCRNLRRSMAYGIRDMGKNLIGLKPEGSKLRRDEFWALKDVSFDVKRGESVGLIGVNGSGKTTLFRAIHGIFPPDKGEIAVSGRIGALIALGAGFHPHLSGRENVYLNGAILGIPRRELDNRLPEIAEFSEIGEFIDAPVSVYSSGMRVRLGFSVAAHMNPDILLVDEVLAVGDQAFKNKCVRYLRNLLSAKRTVMFVSHSMPQVQNVCDRVILLDRGRILADGPTQDVVALYYERSDRATDEDIAKHGSGRVPHLYSTGQVEYLGGCCVDETGAETEEVKPSARTTIRLKLDVRETLHCPHVQLFVHANSPGNSIAFASCQLSDTLKTGTHCIDFTLQKSPLAPGSYYIGSRIANEDLMQKLAYTDSVFRMRVLPVTGGLKTNKPGYFHLEGEWAVNREAADRGSA